MPRRVTTFTIAAALSAAALPAAAQAADYTVDSTAADGCNTAKVCKTVTQAVAAVADGDKITIAPGNYNEPGKIVLTKKNVNIVGTAGKTTISGASATAGDPVITIIEGTILDGVTISAPFNAGPVVLVTGQKTIVRNVGLVRVAASTRDTPGYMVDPVVGSGTSTLDNVTVLNGSGAAGQVAPAIAGNATSSLVVNRAVILSSSGPAIGIIGNDTSGGTPVPNKISRSSLVAAKSTSDALRVTSTATSSTKKVVVVDNSVLLPGTDAAGLSATTLPGAVAGQDSPGDISVTATHITTNGGKFPFYVDAKAGGTTPVGNIDVTFDKSIVRGVGQGTVDSFVPALPLPLAPLVGAPNTAKVTITTSDTGQTAFNGNAGKATVVLTGTSNTDPSVLFVNPAKGNIHLRPTAPVIDKGGEPVAGESDRDIDDQPRKSGVATDLGADEFVNTVPFPVGTASTNKALQNQAVTFDGSKSFDLDGGDKIAQYKWAFGDGTTAVTNTPTTTHAYAALGIYQPTLVVVDSLGAASGIGKIAPIGITDGAPPVVKITKPTKNGSYAILAITRLGKKARKVLDPLLVSKVAFAGTATDDSGIKKVEFSIRRLAIGTAAIPKSPKACTYLDGKTTFKVVACKKALFFTVTQTKGAFSYKLKKALKAKAGRYELTVRATDTAGVIGSAVVAFKLK